MDFAFIQHTVAVMPPFARWAWAAVLLASLAVMILIQFLEHRHFVRLGKAGSWAGLRLLLLIIIPLTAGVLIIPAQAISGPEALAYFYGALFTLAPLTWFGMHLLCGRLLRPAFSKGESLFLAASALFTLFVPVIGLSLAQGPIFMASRSIEENAYQNAPGVALAHVAQAPRRFELPGAGTVFTQSLLAAPGIDLDRVNIRIGEHWAGDKNNLPQWLCRQGNDLHLMWPALEPTPQLRIFWRDAAGQLVRADYSPAADALAAAPAEAFAIGFREDGIDPPAPIPRARVSLGYLRPDGSYFFRGLDMLQPGESFDDNCLMRGYQRVAWVQEGPIRKVALFFSLSKQPAWRAEIDGPTPN
ncbi:MAG: hypothetical protein KA538_07645 [Azonexus sp.]|jgi:hypothetical protein|nr:hypothetical protein [Azonexus sp.]